MKLSTVISCIALLVLVALASFHSHPADALRSPQGSRGNAGQANAATNNNNNNNNNNDNNINADSARRDGGNPHGSEGGAPERIMKETEILQLIEAERVKQDKRLQALNNRLENELAAVHKHFEEIMVKLRKTEDSLAENLSRVENTVLGKVVQVKAKTKEKSGGWKLPFFFLLLAIAGVAAFFGRLYRKATKNSHIL